MKRLLLLAMLLSTAACGASDSGKSVEQLKVEIAQKEAAIEQAKKTGGWPSMTPKVTCVYGVLYYVAKTYGGIYVVSPAISVDTLQPMRCIDTALRPSE